MKTSNSIIIVLFLCLVCSLAEVSCKKNKGGTPTYQKFSDVINSTIHKVEDIFYPYVSHGDPYANKPTFCNAQSCGGCSNQPFENINNCIRWCRSPCMYFSPVNGRGDNILCSKSRHRRSNSEN
uniref:TIL domain-containing protein n=1 Tax=Schizaphis graminum TaxID=13262 RepID=A0A2S2NBX9_SCHGA